MWSTIYNSGGGNTNDFFNRVGVDNSNNIYATGSGGYWGDYLTIKYNSGRVQQWLERYRGTETNGQNESISLALDNQSNVYITGYVTDVGAGVNYDIGTIKYDSNGDSIWVRIFDYSGHADGGCDIKVDILGNVYVNGYTTTSDSSYMTIIKYSGSGNQQWIEYSNGSPTNYKRSLSINNVFDVFAAGDYYVSSTNPDYTSVKYSQLNGLKQISKNIPPYYELFQNYPNPFNYQTIISYYITKNTYVELEIFDILGNLITKLVNRNQNSGTHNVSFDASEYGSGIYFYKLSAGNFHETKKLILIK